ncbi:MAG: elongation factor Ts [Nitrospiraceae bacterium]|nr:MAG: elongation factor Ts [Nitrospiraceae bacterium]
MITADAVKKLREQTGAGMMECKKALTESGGDFDKAVDLLRQKGLAAAAKKAGRIAAEGVIALRVSGTTGVLVEVNSETDFVAKNEEFQKFAGDIAELVSQQNPSDIQILSNMTVGNATVEAKRQELIQKIGENLSVRRFVRFETGGKIASYLHGTRIGVIVDYEGGDEQLGKDLAMQVAASNPLYLSRETVPAEDLNRERAIFEAQAKEFGKPANVIGKIVEGKLEKFFGDTCLIDQLFIKDPDGKQKVKDILKGAVIRRFARFQVGEGIEKKKENFCEEVSAQLK